MPAPLDLRRVRLLAVAVKESLAHEVVDVKADLADALQFAVGELVAECLSPDDDQQMLADRLDVVVALLERWADECGRPVPTVLVTELCRARRGLEGLDWGATETEAKCRAWAAYDVARYFPEHPALLRAAEELVDELDPESERSGAGGLGELCSALVVDELRAVLDATGSHVIVETLRWFGVHAGT